MKPKDLLQYLEKGDHTLENLKNPRGATDDYASLAGQLMSVEQASARDREWVTLSGIETLATNGAIAGVSSFGNGFWNGIQQTTRR